MKRRLKIFTRDNYTCQYCGVLLCNNTATLDHIHQRLYGGVCKVENLRTSCKSCNSSKGANTIEWFRKHSFYKKNNIPYFNDEQINWLKNNGFIFPCHKSYKFHYELEKTSNKEDK